MALLDSIFAPRILRAGVEHVQRDTLEVEGDGVIVEDDPAGDRVTIFVPEANPAHAATHRNQGIDAVDGDRVRVDFVPSTGYTRTVAPVSTAVEDLASHLHGAGIATAAAQSTANAAQATATAAYNTAVAAEAVANTGALMFHCSVTSFNTGGPATKRLYPDWATSSLSTTDWTSKQLVPVTGTLFSICAHHQAHEYTPIPITYRVWRSVDGGVTFTATSLSVAVMSNTHAANSASGAVAVNQGDLIGVEASAPGALGGFERMLATVLLKAAAV
jgi:hypothetical protein